MDEAEIERVRNRPGKNSFEPPNILVNGGARGQETKAAYPSCGVRSWVCPQ